MQAGTFSGDPGESPISLRSQTVVCNVSFIGLNSKPNPFQTQSKEGITNMSIVALYNRQ